MKIYTGQGDKGTTSLVNGQNVSKADIRLDAYGSIDELNSFIGLLICDLKEEEFTSTKAFLTKVQNQLFNIGSQLACDDVEFSKKLPTVVLDDIKSIELEIDKLETNLSPLKEFILPGGTTSASLAHIARTVCRRAERNCCRLAEISPIIDTIIPYLNRLNDYFFVLARFCNHSLNKKDVCWKK